MLGRYPTDAHGLYAQPVRCQDYSGDGVADLVFPGRKERLPGVATCSRWPSCRARISRC
jgi:hypothetical protein